MPEHSVAGDRRPHLSVAMPRHQQEPVTHHDDENHETGKLLKGFVSLLFTFAGSSFAKRLAIIGSRIASGQSLCSRYPTKIMSTQGLVEKNYSGNTRKKRCNVRVCFPILFDQCRPCQVSQYACRLGPNQSCRTLHGA